MKPELKLEGDKAIITFGLEHKVDKDGDTFASFGAVLQAKVELDASEIFEEFIKDADFVQKIKAKLGL